MKKNKFLIPITIAIFAIALTSCNEADNIINPSASMKAKIGGLDWSATLRVPIHKNGGFIITGTDANTGKVIAITFLNDDLGTYSLNPIALPPVANFAAFYRPQSGNEQTATSGVGTITSLDTIAKKIAGTFNFDCTDGTNTVSVTNGTFSDLEYKEE